ncbi:MAG: HD domain-containing protein [Schwartzia sp.]|nr:HD domain-containing protein [Schwartzia sp. (in: firmicutes)]
MEQAATEGLANFLSYARKLANITRWNVEFLYKKASVAEHSFFVAQIAQLIGLIEERNGAVIDWKRLYRKALNHDIKESVTGDIPHHTKHRKEEVNRALAMIEDELVHEYILSEIKDDEYRRRIEEILNEDKDDTLEGRILAAADMIDAMLECAQEIKLGNTNPFQGKYRYWERRLRRIDLVAARYFLEEILPNFDQEVVYEDDEPAPEEESVGKADRKGPAA